MLEDAEGVKWRRDKAVETQRDVVIAYWSKRGLIKAVHNPAGHYNVFLDGVKIWDTDTQTDAKRYVRGYIKGNSFR